MVAYCIGLLVTYKHKCKLHRDAPGLSATRWDGVTNTKINWWLNGSAFDYVTAQIQVARWRTYCQGKSVRWWGRWKGGTVNRSPGYLTVQIHGGTVTHQLSVRHCGMKWQVTIWDGGSMSRCPWLPYGTKAQKDGVMVSWWSSSEQVHGALKTLSLYICLSYAHIISRIIYHIVLLIFNSIIIYLTI